MKPPLRTVLKNFLNHFEDYEARKMLCDDQYEYEFQQLKNLTDKLRTDPDYPCSCAIKDVNRPKNRYKDIVPYDKSRVILPKCDGVPGSDYINASYVKGSSGALAYIAAQGPLPNTVLDFWRMVWVCEVQVLVMACNEKEVGKNKCEVYWPVKGEIKHFGNISVELVEDSQVCPDFLVRTLLVKCDSEMRDVYQFHYTSWPDHGVPDAVQPILELVRLMRECQASETVPILVHCSAGCGRTGTICAVDFVWACLRHGKLTEDFSLFHIALELRRQRIAMIQTKEQYILAHKVVAALFEQQLNVIDCHIYVNIDEDGEPLMWKELIKNKAACFKKEKSPLNQLIQTDDSKLKEKSESKGSTQAIESSLPNSPDSNLINDNLATDSSVGNKLYTKLSILDSLVNSSCNSENSLSHNSCLSQQSNEDSIPFIDDEEVNFRPNCGRAYLNIPSCDTISKIMNYFDPFVDKVALETDDSSPDTDSKMLPQASFQHENNKSKDRTQISDQTLVNNYATLPSSSSNKNQNYLGLNNRDSYPPAASGFSKLDSASDLVLDCGGSSKESKKFCKAGVVRKPSISKLKALFEKSGLSSNKSSNEGGKRSLFRNNSHSVSRAGSAPPSLNCMDKTAAVERESILMMVTRKFRSASVRTEREICSKSACDKSQHRKSNAMNHFKEGFNTLSRTVSFNLTKKFRSYSPTKSKGERTPDATSERISFTSDIVPEGNTKPKSPELPPESKSVWYDKSSLTRAVSVIRPTEKIPPRPLSRSSENTQEKQCLDKNISSVLNRPPRLLFFSTLNKPNGKDVSTVWYGESNENLQCKDSDVKNTEGEVEGAKCYKNTHRVIPFIHSLAPWKRVGTKSPMISPESSKKSSLEDGEFSSQSCNSTFYAKIGQQIPVPPEKLVKEVPPCPIPEEIIPIVPKSENASEILNPFNQSTDTKNMPSSQEDPSTVKSAKVNNAVQIVTVQPNQNKEISKDSDFPPAIPKKIGKSKHHENQVFFNENEEVSVTEPTKEVNSNIKSEPEGKSQSVPVSPKDLYINVNLKAQKNLEQIENTLRNNPRSAIIDLTSRESYCMEEELDNALQQLSAPSEETKPTTVKSNKKFPGYEVIWPQTNLENKQEQIVKSGLAVNDTTTKECKTGICYSPPLRRSLNSNLSLAKCHSCSNIDWIEPDANISLVGNSKEPGSSPTKRLVNEAVVELNTLLDQLTTRTLSEEPELDYKTRKVATCKKAPPSQEHEVPSKQKDNLMVHSVMLLSKSNTSDSPVKEEEIIFHFPPPPPLPPPDDLQPSETFNIVRKNGCMIVKEKSENKSTEASISSEQGSDFKNDCELPQPMPRKSKQGSDLKRSASYTNVSIQPSKYENVFLEKYQTISRLQIVSKDQSCDSKSFELQSKPKIKETLPDYVNISDLSIKNSAEVGKNPVETNVRKFTPPLARTVFGSNKPLINASKDVEATQTASDVSQNFLCAAKGSTMSKDYETYSTYGKISKLPPRKLLDKTSRDLSFGSSEDFSISKKKPAPSKKTERAPRPPNAEITKVHSQHGHVQHQLFTKKLPSRKFEKAPLPPPVLQKCFSSTNVPSKNLSSASYHMNSNPSRPHIVDEALVLPALHENIANTQLSNSVLPMNKRIGSEMKSHGLSHSRSDASVFLALKERKSQSLNRGQVNINTKSPILNKVMIKNRELASVSSSDSDSSYERVFEKPAEQSKDSYDCLKKEQTVTNQTKSNRKEVPVAPPRVRRRNTTEINYAKVKTKEGSPITSKTQDHQKERLPVQELPPAIPLKTKDAFEIPEFGKKAMDHSLDSSSK